MNLISRFFSSLFVVMMLLLSVNPCGPGYVTPLFEITNAPEPPYTDFAAGRLGIVAPGLHRSVLFAAYRYIAGSGMNAAEQRAAVEVWHAELDNKAYGDDSVDEAVKAWVAKRAEAMGKDAKVPEIYAERPYGSYDFFPNCTKNAFETAVETLNDRMSAHGPSDAGVRDWVSAQDQVFENCASGKQVPAEVPVGSPEWLQKDRNYQMAAAAFYSLDYEDAKKRFGEIALDTESPWQETADYLVIRTLIRQASLTKARAASERYYDEAEDRLQRFVSRTGKFSESAERLLGLVKYRRHPRERVSELAKKLAFQSGNDNFRQDLIDYTWLLDKFESDILSAEERRKNEEKARLEGNAAVPTPDETASNTVPSNTDTLHYGTRRSEDDIEIYLNSDDYKQTWILYVPREATDADALKAAEALVGKQMTAEMRKHVVESRRQGYVETFSKSQPSGYEHEYYGEDKLAPSLMPDFLRQDDLTDWLYTFQAQGAQAYLHALDRYKASDSELWLMTAMAKAEKSSTDLPRVIAAASNVSRTSMAYPTVAYHLTRILIEQGKTAEARKVIDDALSLGDILPISARNSFVKLRLAMGETLEDFLRFSLRKPYAFDFDGESGRIEDLIAEQKKWYDPQNEEKQTREAYDAEIESNFKTELEWQNREMFDTDTINIINQHFPTSLMLEAMHSPALPDYMRERFAIAIWTRAFLLDNSAVMLAITPELVKYHPELEPQLSKLLAAKTQPAIDAAALYTVLKNPLLSPYIEDGMGKTDNEFGEFDSNDWWCQPYEETGEEGSVPSTPKPQRPKFVTAAQGTLAVSERKRLTAIGDAPKFLAAKVMDWAKRAPADRRIPEALYIVIQANGWTKYGCGNDEELKDKLAAYLKRTYPGSEWTAKLKADEVEK